MNQYKNRIQTILNSLSELRYSETKCVENICVKKGDYTFAEVYQVEQDTFRQYQKGETWGGTDRHFWFFTVINIPVSYQGKRVIARLNTGATDIWNTDNPQIIVYVNGKMRCAMDMNHNEIILSNHVVAEEKIELAFYAYSNSPEKSNFFNLQIAVFHTEVEALYYDMKVLFDSACLLKDNELNALKTMELLNKCINILDLRCTDGKEFFESVKEADAFLKQNAYIQKPENSDIVVHSIGHTHIDVAWKWQIKQTRQKVVRSFSTVLYLMEQYPEYKFMSSQPQLYQFVKEEAPELFEEIKKKVKEGRWETEGAMWTEADCNLASGESLIRQILYGKRFFKEEFGVEKQEVLWLPDVFGYSVALPQILKKSGIRYFMTTKIGWNEYNKIPNDTFYWQGLDGSEILTYFITTTNYDVYPELNQKPSFSTTYNGRQDATQVKGTWQRYQNKALNQDVLTCYGHGDGGGGPTAQMLEESRRMEYGICDCPVTKQTFVKDYFHLLEKNLEGKAVPKWNGELYLEFHRGTYTSMARNKKNNRQCEFKNTDAEFFSVLALLRGKEYQYPKEELEQAWRLVLLNQFHDILPGSSMKEVYDDCDEQYKIVRNLEETIIKEAKKNIVANQVKVDECEKLVVYNSLSFQRTSIVKVKKHNQPLSTLLKQETKDGEILYLIPNAIAKGMEIYAGKEKQESTEQIKELEMATRVIEHSIEQKNGLKIETKFYQIQFNQVGEFISIYDKLEKREVLKKGEIGNRIQIFEDRPAEFDAWNIDSYYREKSWILDDIQEFKVVENGPIQGCIYLKRKFLSSTVEQYIYFYSHTKRIDFKTTIDWKQQQLLVKVAFPVDILSNKATYEVQFGNVERPTHQNTSWDEAKFEVCAHKWADLCEYGYGVALLNDCKYGYDIHESVMRLTLIKSGIFPNPDADKEIHTFTYSLYPHEGDFRTGKVIQEAYDLNCPLYADVSKGLEEDSYSLLTLSADHVFADVIKQAEEKQDIIIRLYEAYGKRSTIEAISPYFSNSKVWECDCMEQIESELACENDKINFEMKPYEIKTLRIEQVIK